MTLAYALDLGIIVSAFLQTYTEIAQSLNFLIS